jgi:hypothetical protein
MEKARLSSVAYDTVNGASFNCGNCVFMPSNSAVSEYRTWFKLLDAQLIPAETPFGPNFRDGRSAIFHRHV